MNETTQFEYIVSKLKVCAKRITGIAANEAVNFSKARFREQAWLDTKEEPWTKRKAGRRSKQTEKGAVLVRSGRLRRSIRKITVNTNYAIIGTDVPYAAAHNEGFEGSVKQQVRAHYRNKTKLGIVKGKELKRSTKISIVRIKTGSIKVRAHPRTIHQKLPRRRFLAPSQAMNTIIQQAITNEITNALK